VADNTTITTRERSSLLDRLAEQVVLLERAFEEHAAAQLRSSQAEAAQRDRERRTLAELVHRVDSLGRDFELANSRIQALVEEVRRERDARPPLVQGIDDLQHQQATLNSRIGALDQATRRLGTVQSATDQNAERLAGGITRLDDQVKLIDLKLTRELAELRQGMEAWRVHGEETIKPVAPLMKQVTALADQCAALGDRLNQTRQATERVAEEIARVEAQVKSTRQEIGQVIAAGEATARRGEANGAATWQLGTRIDGVVEEVQRVSIELRGVAERIDALVQRIGADEEERRRLESEIGTLADEQRAARRASVEQAEGLGARLAQDLANLAKQSEGWHRQAIDHLRRTTEALQQQLHELEATVS
jgi:chromosome segregation ATPase